MSNKRSLFSVTDTGEGVAVKCEAEIFEICRVFSELYKTSPAFRAMIETSIEMSKRDVNTGLERVDHSEGFMFGNKTQGDA